jgi:TPR repeat protein
MRIEDIRLRDAARRGDRLACLTMAERLFNGKGGFSQNYTIGLAYLQQELNRNTPAAVLLLGNLVPLDLILAHQLVPYLRAAADMGSCMAMLKLGTLMSLRAETRDEGAQMIRRSRISEGFTDSAQFHDPGLVSRFLKELAPEVVNPTELALWGARLALNEQSVERACYFIAIAIAIARGLMPLDQKLAELVFSTVQLAAKSHTTLSLPVDLVENSLQICSAGGEVEAQYGLGCAFAGIPYGQVPSQKIVRRKNFEKAATLLLRAADAGKCDAWFNLSEIVPSSRGALSSKGIARFFLEKAALAGVLEAQTKLGAALLTEASSLENAEEGVRWLGTAADKSCTTAIELLQTLVLPIPELPLDYEQSTIHRIAALDPELGIRVSLARSLHLTRREAMNFNAKRDIKTWGLLIPGASYENPKGRLAPVVTREMRSEVQRTSEFFATSSPIENTLLVQRSRAQRHIFKLLSISEAVFFANEIGRSLSHYGYGRHWASRSASLLERLIDVPREVPDSHSKHLTH